MTTTPSRSTGSARMVEGKIALVTGGAGGIGRATALLLAEEGASAVIVTDVAKESLLESAALIEALGVPALAVEADMLTPSDPDEVVEQVRTRFGRLDIAVNAAGIDGPVKPIDAYSDAEWLRVIDVNLNSMFRCMRAEVQLIVATGGGTIVNVSSGVTVDPVPNMSAYVASKKGILGLSRAAAGEYISKGVRINCVLPGPILTPMLDIHSRTEQGKRQAANHPMARFGQPREAAEAIVWLSSSRASYVVGVELQVDGGSHAFWY